MNLITSVGVIIFTLSGCNRLAYKPKINIDYLFLIFRSKLNINKVLKFIHLNRLSKALSITFDRAWSLHGFYSPSIL